MAMVGVTLEELKREHVYCRHCGQKMIADWAWQSFDRKTGQPLPPEVTWRCQRFISWTYVRTGASLHDSVTITV